MYLILLAQFYNSSTVFLQRFSNFASKSRKSKHENAQEAVCLKTMLKAPTNLFIYLFFENTCLNWISIWMLT